MLCAVCPSGSEPEVKPMFIPKLCVDIRLLHMVSKAGDGRNTLGKWQSLIHRDWKQRFQCFRVATKLNKENGEVQVSSLIHAMGPEAENIFKAFTFTEDADQKKFDVVLGK